MISRLRLTGDLVVVGVVILAWILIAMAGVCLYYMAPKGMRKEMEDGD